MSERSRHGDLERVVRLELVRLVVGRDMELDSGLVVVLVVVRLGVVSANCVRENESGRGRFWRHRCLAFGSRVMLRSRLAAVEEVAQIVVEAGLDMRVGLEVLDAYVILP